MCSVARLDTLCRLFDQAQSAGKHAGLTPPVGTFAEEVSDLFLRYKPGAKTQTSGLPEDPKDQWSTHPRIMTATQQHLHTTKERFASPLNVSDATCHYWSKHARDQVFGAQHDAYSCKWTGHSQAFPDHDDASLERAVRWALWSAHSSSKPTSTLLVLPRSHKGKGNPAYRKWMESHPQFCHHLATIPHQKPGGCVWRDEGWQNSVSMPELPAWKLEIVLIWNKAAQQEWCGKEHHAHTALFALQRAMDDPEVIDNMPLSDLHRRQHDSHNTNALLVRRLTAPWTDTDPQSLDKYLDGVIRKAPRKFQGKPEDMELEAAGAPHTAPANKPYNMATRLRLITKPTPLLYDWRRIAYTDGSCIEHNTPTGKVTCVGAGLYCPAKEDKGQKACFTVDPAGQAPNNTINRAELAGIWAALMQGEHIIATDSACSIAQLQTELLQPMRHRTHKHANLLAAIVDLMRAAKKPITLMKIKAHNQHIGNEIADGIAKQAAQPNATHDLTLSVSATPAYIKGFWLWQTDAKAEQRHTSVGDEDAGPPAKRLRPLSHPQDLQKLMHDKLRLGTANQDSVYFNAWKDAHKHTLPSDSNAFMAKNSSVTQGQRRTTLRYRMGVLWNQKRAKMIGRATSDKCPLCHQPDGCSHIASGCSHHTMEKMYTERHNRAGRLILRAVSKGERGNDLVMADVGAHAKCAEAGAPTLDCNSIPNTLIPCKPGANKEEQMLHAKTLRRLKPDALLVSHGRHKTDTKVEIVEIKYCIDTRPERQLSRAREQHNELKDLLAAQGFLPSNITVIPILIGVSGTVYTEYTKLALEKLGVPHAKTRTCISKLHTEAIRSLHSIVQVRRHYEHTSNTNFTQKPP